VPGLIAQKARQLGTNLLPKYTLRFAQSSFSNQYFMNAMLAEAWAMVIER
jgi:hypothetical protein